MKHPLYRHFVFLEERIQHLRDQITHPHRTSADLARLRSELHIVERALTHYRAALDLEAQLSPPANAPDTAPDTEP